MSNDKNPADEQEIVILRVYIGETEVDQQAFSKDKIVLGRDAYADVCLEDPMVSRVHCTIHRENGGLLFTDHSSNGTIVNGVNRRSSTLHHGDAISLGRFRVIVAVHNDRRLLDEQMLRSRGLFTEDEPTIRGPVRGS